MSALCFLERCVCGSLGASLFSLSLCARAGLPPRSLIVCVCRLSLYTCARPMYVYATFLLLLLRTLSCSKKTIWLSMHEHALARRLDDHRVRTTEPTPNIVPMNAAAPAACAGGGRRPTCMRLPTHAPRPPTTAPMPAPRMKRGKAIASCCPQGGDVASICA